MSYKAILATPCKLSLFFLIYYQR